MFNWGETERVSFFLRKWRVSIFSGEYIKKTSQNVTITCVHFLADPASARTYGPPRAGCHVFAPNPEDTIPKHADLQSGLSSGNNFRNLEFYAELSSRLKRRKLKKTTISRPS